MPSLSHPVSARIHRTQIIATPPVLDRSLSACALLLFVAVALATTLHAQTNPKHFFWAPGQPNTPQGASLANDLIYHGGNAGTGAIGVESKPATYLIFWGPDWQNGFSTTDANGVSFTSQTLQNYVTSFLTNLGGTSWAAIQTEYCKNAPAGTTNCASVSGAKYITNPINQLKGAWTDPTPSPATSSPLASPRTSRMIPSPPKPSAPPPISTTIPRRPTSSSLRRRRSPPASPSIAAITPRPTALTAWAIPSACNTPSFHF